MNPAKLLALYERVADAPDAIPRLRRFVLDLAVRGKLVAQDPNDEPASELLKRIAAERARLSKAGKISNMKALPRVTHDQLGFTIPPHWEPLKLGEILDEIQTGPFGSALHQSDYVLGGTPVINPASLQNSGIVPIDKMAVGPVTLKRLSSFTLYTGDIIMARRGEMGRCALVTEAEAGWLCGTGSLILRPSKLLYAPFLVLMIGSPFSREYLGGTAVGTTMQNLNQSILLNLPFGLPPLAEQRRIVAKVDELMALLDRLEAARTAREVTRDRLTATSLARLTAPDTTPEVFPTHARFALDALPALTTRPDQIKSLRQTILNLAVRGKLVQQDPTDEPASELLSRISVEKARLIKSGEIGKDKPLTPLGAHEMPFELPGGWNWCRLGALVLSSDAGWSPRTENQPREGEAWGVLKVSAVSWDRFNPGANKQVLPGTEPRLQAQVHEGDFLISRANTAELVARAVLVTEEPLNLMMSDKIVRLRLAPAFDHSFAWLVNNYGDYARAYYAENATGVSPSMKNVSRAAILHLPFPLPPLAEQHRIVAKVDELMALCTRLETGLNTTETAKQRLLEALLRETLEPTSKEAA